jgi:hypothetical protein
MTCRTFSFRRAIASAKPSKVTSARVLLGLFFFLGSHRVSDIANSASRCIESPIDNYLERFASLRSTGSWTPAQILHHRHLGLVLPDRVPL